MDLGDDIIHNPTHKDAICDTTERCSPPPYNILEQKG